MSAAASPRAPLRPSLPRPGDGGGPTVRLGVAWGLALLSSVFAGPNWMAVVLAPAAGLAAWQAARSWRTATGVRRRRAGPPVDAVAAAGSVVLVVASTLGVLGIVVGLAIVGIGLGVLSAAMRVRVASGRLRRSRSAWRTVQVIAVTGGAAAAPIVLRAASTHGSVPALVLCTYAVVYDASAFLVGAGSSRPWEGPAAGVVATVAVTVGVAAVFVPPFRGASPWVLGVVAAIAALAGPALARSVLGDGRARVPAVRRLDSLAVLGPVWTALCLAVVH